MHRVARLVPFAALLPLACAGARAPENTKQPSAPAAAEVAADAWVASQDAAPTPAPDTSSANLDGKLPAPDSAEVVAALAGGDVLLSIQGTMLGRPHVPPDVAVSDEPALVEESYFAVLDTKSMCLTETATTDHVQLAIDASEPSDILAKLREPATETERDRLSTLATRFGVHSLAPFAFGVDGTTIAEIDNYMYIRTSSTPFVALSDHPAHSPTASPDGSEIAFARCSSPCNGIYEPTIYDVRSGRVRSLPIGDSTGFSWSADGTLFFAYDDRPNGMKPARNICLGRVDPHATRARSVRCFRSAERNSENSVVASPDNAKVAIAIRTPDAAKTDELVILALPGGNETARLTASPLYPKLDVRGRVAWDDNDTPKFHFRAKVDDGRGDRQIFPEARSVGWLADGRLLLRPDFDPSDGTRESPPLSKMRCRAFKTAQPQ